MLHNWLALWKRVTRIPSTRNRVSRRHRLQTAIVPHQTEILEDRTLLAVTAMFEAGVLTVNLDGPGDAVFLQVDEGNIDVGTTEGGEDVLMDQAGVTEIIVQDSSATGALRQSVTFSVGDAAFTQNVTVENIESVNLNQDITGTISGINVGTVNMDDFGQIQDGIDVAAAGATVNVAAGIYDGNLVIEQPVNLIGAGSDVTTITTTAAVEYLIFLGGRSVPTFGEGMTIEGFTLTSSSLVGDSDLIGLRASGPNAGDPIIIRNNVFDGQEMALGIETPAGGGTANILIEDNLFQDTRYGMFLNSAIDWRIEGNTFIDTIRVALAINTSNENQTHEIDILNNTFFGSGVLTDFPIFSGAVQLASTVFNVTVTGNVIADGNGYAVYVQDRGNLAFTNVQISNNNITNNGLGSTNELTVPLDMSANWWGTTDDAAIAATLTGPIDFTPFLGSEIDQDPSTDGFQGDFSKLFVTSLGEQTAPLERISEAVALVTDPGVINIYPGVYNDDLNASGKSLMITVAGDTGQVAINNLTVDADDTLKFEVNGVATPGADYDQLDVTGTVTLSGSTLSTFGTVPGTSLGDEIVLIDNDGIDIVVGEFDGLPEDSNVVINGEIFTISYAGGDGNDVALVSTGESADIIAIAPGPGTPGIVQVFSAATQELRFFIEPFPGFTGGVHVAVGDVNLDGIPDIIAGAGAGGGPHVKVIDGSNGTTELFSFFAYAAAFRGGVNVAAADLDGDGRADIITGAGAGGGPHVQAFSGLNGSVLFSLFAYDPRFGGGVNVAAGDISGDGTPDIITGAGPGGGPHVRVFDGLTGAQVAGLLGSFYAYDPIFAGGVFVAAGDVNDDGRVDLITGAGAGGGPHVRVFDGLTGSQLAGPLGSFYAYDPIFAGGVRVAAADIDNDGRADVITVPGQGGGPHLRIFDGASVGAPQLIRDVFVEDADYKFGLTVGASVELESDLVSSTLDLVFTDGDALGDALN